MGRAGFHLEIYGDVGIAIEQHSRECEQDGRAGRAWRLDFDGLRGGDS